jgi:hypothetical protein
MGCLRTNDRERNTKADDWEETNGEVMGREVELLTRMDGDSYPDGRCSEFSTG